MSTNELHLDKLTYARAKRLAEEKKISVEELVSEAIERYTVDPNKVMQPPDGTVRDLPRWEGRVIGSLSRRELYDDVC